MDSKVIIGARVLLANALMWKSAYFQYEMSRNKVQMRKCVPIDFHSTQLWHTWRINYDYIMNECNNDDVDVDHNYAQWHREKKTQLHSHIKQICTGMVLYFQKPHIYWPQLSLLCEPTLTWGSCTVRHCFSGLHTSNECSNPFTPNYFECSTHSNKYYHYCHRSFNCKCIEYRDI